MACFSQWLNTMRILYIAYDGKYLSGWWEVSPGNPPQPGKRWNTPGVPHVYGEFNGTLQSVLIKLIDAKIIPQHDATWSYQILNEQWAKRGIDIASKINTKPIHKHQGGLFASQYIGKVDHRGHKGDG